MPNTRHYIARDKSTGKPIAIIEAASVAQARSHLSKRSHDVVYADQVDLMDAIKAGIEPEKAGDAAEE